MNNPDNLISGRRSFDRQIELLTVAVHTLQRDFAALEERVRGVTQASSELAKTVHHMDEEVHRLDKSLVARVATISVAERALWLVITVLVGLGVKFLGG